MREISGPATQTTTEAIYNLLLERVPLRSESPHIRIRGVWRQTPKETTGLSGTLHVQDPETGRKAEVALFGKVGNGDYGLTQQHFKLTESGGSLHLDRARRYRNHTHPTDFTPASEYEASMLLRRLNRLTKPRQTPTT